MIFLSFLGAWFLCILLVGGFAFLIVLLCLKFGVDLGSVDPSDLADPANPLSPLSPANPVNPASPLFTRIDP